MTHELSIQDMSAEQVELLPGRETLAVVRSRGVKFNTANFLANNSSLALNAGTFGAADAFANSQVAITSYQS